eukprot:5553454-Amphidinium_carterae.1
MLASARRHKMNIPYLAAALSETPANIHEDRNFGLSCTVYVGDFTGGELRVFDEWSLGKTQQHRTVSTQNAWTLFDPMLPHM